MILVADCCRTARHALAAIARARPGVFITSVAKEIARYNTLATNAQTLNVNLQMHVLTRSKAEVLHVVEQLIATDSALSEMRDLLTDVVDIVLHCVDHNHLKQRPLSEVFPPIQTFNQVRNSRYHEQFVFRLKKKIAYSTRKLKSPKWEIDHTETYFHQSKNPRMEGLVIMNCFA